MPLSRVTTTSSVNTKGTGEPKLSDTNAIKSQGKGIQIREEEALAQKLR
jgi:hypothetical protein